MSTNDDLDARTAKFVEGMMAGASEFGQQQADSLEDRRVVAILTELGMGARIKEFRHERKQLCDNTQLDCLWFANRFPGCPIQFSTASLSGAIAKRKFPKDWFMAIDKVPMVPVFDLACQIYADHGIDSAVGLIFSWPGWHTPLILHNWQYKRTIQAGYWAYYRKDLRMRIYMEPLSTVLTHILQVWTPE